MIKQRFRRFRQHLPVLALVGFGIFVSALCFVALHSFEVERAKVSFQRAAQERFDDVQSDLDIAVNQVVALGSFCESSYPITRSSFDGFVKPLIAGRDSEIQALEWVPSVSLAERTAFEKRARAEGSPGFEIRDRLDPGSKRMARSGDRPGYFPVLYVQPYQPNESVRGFDVLVANPRRHEALSHAASTAELTATQRVALIQGKSDQYGVIFFRPVFGGVGSSFGGKKLLGFAVGAVRIGEVIEMHGAGSGVDLSVADLSAEASESQLYPSQGKPPQPVSALTQYRMMSVGGRDWRVTASPVPGVFVERKAYSYAGGAFCLLLTLLAAAYMVCTLDRRRKVEQVVEERTGALNAAMFSLAEAHRGIEASEARYRRLIEDAPVGIVVERRGTIELVNRAALEMLGFDSARDIENRHLAEFVISERREYAADIVGTLYSREMQLPSRETKVVRRDGSILDIEIAASSFLDAGVQTVQVLLTDISQRKVAEAEKARLIQAIEQVGDSIVITDLEANIVYVNPAFERISGYSREEALGKNPRILSSGRQSNEFYNKLWDLLKGGESWSGQFVNRDRNGRLFTEEATISPVTDGSGQTTNYVAVKRDVTLENTLHEQLHESQKMDAIGRLAGGMAHDFNNMLMVIVSYADLLENSLPDGDPLRKHTEQILRASERSSALIRQLLAFSRKQVLEPRILDCNAIVTETSSMVRRLIAENIDLKCSLAPEIWPVKADADQMVQVILNLCVNSRDAMPHGGSLVLATRNYHVGEGFVELSVSDTGTGIPLEIQEKLFEPFFTTKARGKGTGLGLATVYGIVQQSGGHIRVESSPGEGATFNVYIPRCWEAVPTPEIPIKKSLHTGQGLVLLVEDEGALREAIADHLRNHGYLVLAARDGVEALEILAKNPDVSVLISDLVMPRMGGRELVRLASEQGSKLEVILMSGYDDEACGAEDLAGCSAVVLQKPFSMNILLARMAGLNQRMDVSAS